MKKILILCFLVLFYNYSAAINSVYAQEPICTNWLSSQWEVELIPESEELKLPQIPTEIKCDINNFDLFFAVFAEDYECQKSRTVFPLKMTTNALDLYEDEKIITKVNYYNYPNHLLSCPIFPNKAQRKNDNLKLKIEEGDEICTVYLLTNHGFGVSYLFLWQECWYLSEIIIDSF